MADIAVYDPKELLVILFDHVANFLSVGSGWRFDSVQSLAISLCPTDDRSRVLHTNAQVSTQKVGPQYPKPQRRLLFYIVLSSAYSRSS